jgi:hypothetical protein
MTLGLDYSGGRPGGAAIRSAGYTFAVRYLDNGLGPGRANLTSAEVSDLRNHGVDVALVWERKLVSGPDRATQGRAAGAADAAAATQAASAVGLSTLPIYFAVDFDAPDYAPNSPDPAAKLGPIGEYFGGIRSVLPIERVGVYGGYWPVKRVLDAGLALIAWQTVAWSGGNEDPRIALFQRAQQVTVGGVLCDVNEARQVQFGQNAIPAPAPTPGDIVFEFIANTDSPLADPTKSLSATNGYAQVKLLLGGGLLGAATWNDVKAKDKAFTGDGTGSVLGVGAGQYQAYLDTDTAVRAAVANLEALTGGGSGGGATKAEVAEVVADAVNGLSADIAFHAKA